MILGQLFVVDAVDDRQVGAVRRGGNQHALGAGGQMQRRLFAGGEDAGALDGDVDAQILVRQLGRILDRGDLNLVAGHRHDVAFHRNRSREAAVDGIVLQEMRIGRHRAEIVDRDDFDIATTRFHDGAQDQPADAAEPIDCNTNGHELSPIEPK